MKDHHTENTPASPFRVINGGLDANPGMERQASAKASPDLPEGFTRASHESRHGGIPVTGPDGKPGELMVIDGNDMPPELLMLLMLASMSRRKS